ncbi:MAG TPA: hypothetical protein VJP77_04995, partial [Planctomycetota bacterium]|nr:hypothetical protein [Planctomycetota bacterium]
APPAVAAALAASLGALAPSAAAQTPPPFQIQVQYDPFALPPDPTWGETIAQLTYPPGHGPVSQGYPVAPRPVFITLRGGNSNNLVPGVLSTPILNETIPNAFGFVSVLCNFPIIDPGEDYQEATDGARLLVQYLRENAPELNIDPERVFVQGRSFGAVVGYALALQHDAADPGAGHPQLAQSSRPDYYAARFGPSNLTCFSTQVGPWASTMSLFFFPGQAFEDSTPEQRLAESSTWWLLNPQLYGRTETPPMCIAYFVDHPDVCGETTDVHSGVFGEAMIEAVELYARQTNDPEYLAQLGTVDQSIFPDPLIGIVEWSVERLADTYQGLWLAPPSGSVSGPGATVTLNALSAEPGGTVSFYAGTQAGNFPIPGCPNMQGEIVDFTLVGTAVADSAGVATLVLPGNPALLGQDVLFHSVDFATCLSSNVVVHRWY